MSSVKSETMSVAPPNALMNAGLTASKPLVMSFCTAASQLPTASSNVFVDLAASTAASVMPSSISAWSNSSALISPFSMASRKLPV